MIKVRYLKLLCVDILDVKKKSVPQIIMIYSKFYRFLLQSICNLGYMP